MNKKSKYLFYSAGLLLVLVLFFYGLLKAKGFLAPFLTAVILSLVMLPLAQKMEHFMSRPWASFLNSLILLLVSVGFMALVSLQVKRFVNDWPTIKDKMQPKIEQVKNLLVNNSPLEKKDLQLSQKGENSYSFLGTGSKVGDGAGSMVSSVISFFGNYLLTFIYIFFLLNYRNRFKAFLLRIFPDEKKQQVKTTIKQSAEVAPEYLLGKLILMGILAVLYAIGLGISGVNNFIVISFIASFLTLIPYVGNIIGFFIALAFGFLTTGDTMVLVGIILTFTIAQFVESYILEPFLLGDRVDLHPFFVILVVVIGNMVWGIIGMILAIPLLGIVTVILLHTKELHAYGIFLSTKKVKNWD